MVQNDVDLIRTSISHVSKPIAKGVKTQYIIRVADERSHYTSWLVYKRYSEFRTLRDALLRADLCERCHYLTQELSVAKKFPPKRLVFLSQSEWVLNERKLGLNVFLEVVVQCVRRCKDPACESRTLLEAFLVIPDMRYTFIDMNLEKTEVKCTNELSRDTKDTSESTNQLVVLEDRMEVFDRLMEKDNNNEENESKHFERFWRYSHPCIGRPSEENSLLLSFSTQNKSFDDQLPSFKVYNRGHNRQFGAKTNKKARYSKHKSSSVKRLERLEEEKSLRRTCSDYSNLRVKKKITLETIAE